MNQVVNTSAEFKKPNILILDTPLNMDFTRAKVTIEPLENDNGNKYSLRGSKFQYIKPTEPVADSEWQAAK